MTERRVWRAIALMVSVTTVLFGGAWSWAALMHQTTVVDLQPQQGHVSRLELDLADADAEIDPAPDDQVTVRENVAWTLRRPTVAMTWDGNVLKVSVRCRRLLPLKEAGCRTRLQIAVPADTKVTGRSTSGDTIVRGLSGDVRLQSKSGSIELLGIRGSVWAKSSSGQIVGLGLAGPSAATSTDSGSAELSFDRPPTDVTMLAASGDLTVAVPAGSRYRVSGHSTSGDRSIDPEVIDAGSPYKIDLSTTSGSASVHWATG